MHKNQNPSTRSVRTRKKRLSLLIPILLAFVTCLNSTTTIAQAPGDEPIAAMIVEANGITWQPTIDHAGLTLTVSGSGGLILQQEFGPGSTPAFAPVSPDGQPHPDGSYTYELQAAPVMDPETRAALEAAREAGNSDAVAEQLRQAGKLPDAMVQSGHFSIKGGQIVLDDAPEPAPPDQWLPSEDGDSSITPQGDNGAVTPQDVLHYDDVIITGSLCVGFDCQDGESFGFDTTILKEHNLRIYFNDTSYTASYPTNNWRITVNDSTNGGASYFSVDDVDDGTSIFKIEAGAPSNSLYVEDYGRVGLGTSTPVVELHIKDSDTPTVRLEQDSSGGWTAQTWDVAGNESNFFIRDATNGSKLPFRIQPSTPSSSLCLKSDGKAGFGTWSPAYSIELETTNEDAVFAAERTDGATVKLAAGAETVQIGSVTDHLLEFVVNDSPVMWLNSSGNLTLNGAVIESSDANAKENLIAVDGQDVLVRLADVPITTWNYTADGDTVRHMGPMAQDFHAAFGLGPDERHIAPLDANGVALVAAQELYRIVQAQDARIAQLEQQNADLEARIAALEASVEALMQTPQE
jgi:hypothetical protein